MGIAGAFEVHCSKGNGTKVQAKIVTAVTSLADSYDLTTLAVGKGELSTTNGASDTTLKRYLS